MFEVRIIQSAAIWLKRKKWVICIGCRDLYGCMDQQQQQQHQLTFQQEFRLIHRLKAIRYAMNIVIQFFIDQNAIYKVFDRRR